MTARLYLPIQECRLGAMKKPDLYPCTTAQTSQYTERHDRQTARQCHSLPYFSKIIPPRCLQKCQILWNKPLGDVNMNLTTLVITFQKKKKNQKPDTH